MTVPLLRVEHRWECLSCDLTHVTYRTEPHSPFHNCRGLAALSVPFVPAGTKGKHEAREREDYIGQETIQTNGEGRPIMNVQTIRDDGEDCTVFAPCATAGGDI